MKKIRILVLVLLSIGVEAKIIQFKGETVKKVRVEREDLFELLSEYAQARNISISYPVKMRKGHKVSLTLSRDTGIAEFHEILLKSLGNVGLTLYKQLGNYIVVNERDIRYIPTELFDRKDVPSTNAYVTMIHRFNFPIAKDATRSLRPFLSRYGRVISLGDNQTMVVKDRGNIILGLNTLIEDFDNKKYYMKVKKRLRKEASDGTRQTEQEKKIKKLKEQIKKMKNEQRGKRS